MKTGCRNQAARRETSVRRENGWERIEKASTAEVGGVLVDAVGGDGEGVGPGEGGGVGEHRPGAAPRKRAGEGSGERIALKMLDELFLIPIEKVSQIAFSLSALMFSLDLWSFGHGGVSQ
ncbi:hypothetical protein RHSIM_Rhsim13G0167900 [Rhododendron simsii]|uniref:Uncharacterized protein n=1 Tax=Rhododendron simsii TaxID=118357 RepID=A0A834L7L2_RHOSS|nr:hypothetical protein RHSIM_Rhsim13G0167900 [Rhododendron simsii]